jgi:hypothetical protein
MNEFDWDALRVGDAILVHHPLSALPQIPVPSRVAFVHVHGRRRNEVGTRADGTVDRRVTWPTFLQVHRDDAIDACPWCSTVAESSRVEADEDRAGSADVNRYFGMLDRMRAAVDDIRDALAAGSSVDVAAAEAELDEFERRGRVRGYLA